MKSAHGSLVVSWLALNHLLLLTLPLRLPCLSVNLLAAPLLTLMASWVLINCSWHSVSEWIMHEMSMAVIQTSIRQGLDLVIFPSLCHRSRLSLMNPHNTVTSSPPADCLTSIVGNWALWRCQSVCSLVATWDGGAIVTAECVPSHGMSALTVTPRKPCLREKVGKVQHFIKTNWQ